MIHLAANVHCYYYSQLLRHMLSSFQLFPPKRHKFSLTVCYDPDDIGTREVMDFFSAQQAPENYSLRRMPMTQEEVCARAIGKNRFAQEVIAGKIFADWCWWTDCDYSIGGHGDLDFICDTLAAQDFKTIPITENGAVYWPGYVSAWDYDLSEKSIRMAKETAGYVGLDPADAVPHRIKIAIGGVQFVPAATVIKVGGYCQNSVRHQRPSPNGWRENKEDKAFRKQVGAVAELPSMEGHLFRMRHRERGANGKVEL